MTELQLGKESVLSSVLIFTTSLDTTITCHDKHILQILEKNTIFFLLQIFNKDSLLQQALIVTHVF